jgi:hypothetical protein
MPFRLVYEEGRASRLDLVTIFFHKAKADGEREWQIIRKHLLGSAN